jgi:hypothetical protein
VLSTRKLKKNVFFYFLLCSITYDQVLVSKVQQIFFAKLTIDNRQVPNRLFTLHFYKSFQKAYFKECRQLMIKENLILILLK